MENIRDGGFPVSFWGHRIQFFYAPDGLLRA
jgi:hypothetical protein